MDKKPSPISHKTKVKDRKDIVVVVQGMRGNWAAAEACVPNLARRRLARVCPGLVLLLLRGLVDSQPRCFANPPVA